MGSVATLGEYNEACGNYGIRERVRYCANPVPTNKGRECWGESSEIEPENRELCQSDYFCSSVALKFM